MDKNSILELLTKKLKDREWFYRSFTARCGCCRDEYDHLEDDQIDDFVASFESEIDCMEANNEQR